MAKAVLKKYTGVSLVSLDLLYFWALGFRVGESV